MYNFCTTRIPITLCICIDQFDPASFDSCESLLKADANSNASLVRNLVYRIINSINKNEKLKYSVDFNIVPLTKFNEFSSINTLSKSIDQCILNAYTQILERIKRYNECEIPYFTPIIIFVTKNAKKTLAGRFCTSDNHPSNTEVGQDVKTLIEKHCNQNTSSLSDFIIPIKVTVGSSKELITLPGVAMPFADIMISEDSDLEYFTLFERLPYFRGHRLGSFTRKLLVDEFAECVTACQQEIERARHERQENSPMERIRKDMEELLADLSGIDEQSGKASPADGQ